MVAKVVLIALVFWAIVGLVLYASLKYGLPTWLDYRESKDEREHKRELQQLERDEALVEEAEREYERERN